MKIRASLYYETCKMLLWIVTVQINSLPKKVLHEVQDICEISELMAVLTFRHLLTMNRVAQKLNIAFNSLFLIIRER